MCLIKMQKDLLLYASNAGVFVDTTTTKLKGHPSFYLREEA